MSKEGHLQRLRRRALEGGMEDVSAYIQALRRRGLSRGAWPGYSPQPPAHDWKEVLGHRGIPETNHHHFEGTVEREPYLTRYHGCLVVHFRDEDRREDGWCYTGWGRQRGDRVDPIYPVDIPEEVENLGIRVEYPALARSSVFMGHSWIERLYRSHTPGGFSVRALYRGEWHEDEQGGYMLPAEAEQQLGINIPEGTVLRSHLDGESLLVTGTTERSRVILTPDVHAFPPRPTRASKPWRQHRGQFHPTRVRRR